MKNLYFFESHCVEVVTTHTRNFCIIIIIIIIWQRDVGNEGRGYAKTRKNREDDDQMDCGVILSDKKASARH